MSPAAGMRAQKIGTVLIGVPGHWVAQSVFKDKEGDVTISGEGKTPQDALEDLAKALDHCLRRVIEDPSQMQKSKFAKWVSNNCLRLGRSK